MRRPTLLPAHSQGLVAVSSIELSHDRSRLRTRLHSLSRHFYESLLLRSNGLSSFKEKSSCSFKAAHPRDGALGSFTARTGDPSARCFGILFSHSAARPLAGARGSLIDRAVARSVSSEDETSFAEPPFL